jgi:alkylhydroperoxidase family enzyme
LSEEEIRQAQGFESDDARRASGLRFVREVVETRGHPSDEALDGAREAGFSDEEILEMVAHVALTTFSNYTNDLAGTELDIPKVERVHS